MIDSKIIDDIVQRLIEGLPKPLLEMGEDVEKSVKAGLQGALAKLELVTQDEFDAQVRVLHRTREKVDALEKVLEELTQETDSDKQ